MGCDIHMVLEIYDGRHGIWVGLHGYDYIMKSALEYDIVAAREHPKYFFWHAKQRNYSLFTELAGVRGDSATMLAPRGVPDDVSDLARWRIDRDEGDGHTHSWVTLDEFVQCYKRTMGEKAVAHFAAERVGGGKLDVDDAIANMVAGIEPSDYEDNDENGAQFRVVFWFDN